MPKKTAKPAKGTARAAKNSAPLKGKAFLKKMEAAKAAKAAKASKAGKKGG